MKFLVLGAGGMAGHTIAIYLKEQGYDVTGFARRELPFVETIVGDVTEFSFIKGIILSGNYDYVINAIGILNQNAQENKANAVILNGYLPHFLANITKNISTKIIHMSTDCVFSGKKGNYTEGAFRDGETFYDRSKAIGELEDDKNVTLRNSIVGPDINPNGIGLLNWFMRQNGIVKGYTHAMWTGMTTLQLAKMMEKVALKGATGLYNMVPKSNISKFELLNLFNHYLKNEKIKIQPFDDFSVDKTLIRTRYDFADEVPNYDIMVLEMAEWIKKHKYLYPHYNL